MNILYEIAMSAPKPVMALMIFMLGFGFACVSIMNKNLRRTLRDLRKELEAALKGDKQTRRRRNKTKRGQAPPSNKEHINVPPRPT